jgi:hypothetical protein
LFRASAQDVEAQEVVHWQAEAGDRRAEFESVVRAMPVVVMKEDWEASGALSGMGVAVSVSPFAERGLNEAFDFAVGLWSRGASKAVLEAEGGNGGAHEVRAIAGTIVGVEALGLDAVAAEEGEGGVEESDGAGGGLIWEELGEREAGMIVDGDVEELPTGAADMIVLRIAGDAMARADDAGEFLDVEVNELARAEAPIALDRWWRGELGEAEAVPVEQTGDGGLGELGGVGDLKAWEFPEAENEHAGDPQRVGGARRTKRA